MQTGKYYLLAEVIEPSGLISISATSNTIAVTAPFIKLAAAVGTVTPTNLTAHRSGFLNITITNSGNIAALGLLKISVSPSSSSTDNTTESTLVIASTR